MGASFSAGGGSLPTGVPKTCISDRPAFWVVELTPVTVIFRLVVARAGKLTVRPVEPEFDSEPKLTCEASENVSVPEGISIGYDREVDRQRGLTVLADEDLVVVPKGFELDI